MEIVFMQKDRGIAKLNSIEDAEFEALVMTGLIEGETKRLFDLAVQRLAESAKTSPSRSAQAQTSAGSGRRFDTRCCYPAPQTPYTQPSSPRHAPCATSV